MGGKGNYPLKVKSVLVLISEDKCDFGSKKESVAGCV
jgi:hypothetical protein